MTDRSVISVHASPELADRLARLAKLTRRSKSSLANQAIESYVAAEEDFLDRITAGQADRAAGRTRSTEDLLAHARARYLGSKPA